MFDRQAVHDGLHLCIYIFMEAHGSCAHGLKLLHPLCFGKSVTGGPSGAEPWAT